MSVRCRTFVLLILAGTTASIATVRLGGEEPPANPVRPAAQDALLDTLVTLETSYLDAIKRKDVAALRRLSAADKSIVYEDGKRQSLDEFLAALSDWTMTGYELTEPKAVALSPDAAVLTCRITTTFGNGDRTARRTVVTSSVWARRWQGIAFHETACLKPDAAPAEPAAAELVRLERSYWEALRTVDRPTLLRLTAPEKVVVLTDGSRLPQADVLAGLGKNWTMTGYALDDIRVIAPAQDYGVVSYRATTTINGKEKSIRATSVWARRWQVCSYHESTPK